MLERQRPIVLLHPDPLERTRLAHALHGHRVEAPEPSVRAVAELDGTGVALVIASESCQPRILRELQARAPDGARTLLVYDGADPGAAARLAGASGTLSFDATATSDGDAVRQGVERILSPRGEQRAVAIRPLVAILELREGRVLGTLCDASSAGLGLLIDASAAVEWLEAGAAAVRVELLDGPDSVMEAARPVVRSVVRVEPGLYRVGLQLSASAPDAEPVVEPRLADPLLIQALFQQSVASEALCAVRGLGADGLRGRGKIDRLVRTSRGAALRLTSALPFAPSTVVELNLECGGRTYQGICTVVEDVDGAPAVLLPPALTPRHRRNRLRFRPPPDAPLSLAFTSPLTGRKLSLPVLDAHPGALCVEVELDEPLPPGLRVPATLEGRGTPEPIEVAVLGIRPAGTISCCALAIRAPSTNVHRRLTDAFIRSRDPNIHDGREVAFREIWALMEAAGYRFHPDHPFGDQKVLEVLEETHLRATSAPTDLARSVVYRDGAELLGHSSVLRMFSRTWMPQHLAIRPGFHRQQQVARQISVALEYVETLEDADYVRYYWRTDNRWPNRIFGRMARLCEKTGRSMVRKVRYLRRQNSAGVAAPSVHVRRYVESDAVALATLLRSEIEPIRLRAADLVSPGWRLEEIGACYASAGLERGRTILVHQRDGILDGVALVEHATPGLCLIEATNAVEVVVSSRASNTAEIAAALLDAASDVYARSGRPFTTAMIEAQHVPAAVGLGFDELCEFAEWTFHRKLLRDWHTMFVAAFDRVLKPGSAE